MRSGAPQAHDSLLANDRGNAKGEIGKATAAGRPQGTLLANATKRAMRIGDRKGSPLLYTSESACQARVE